MSSFCKSLMMVGSIVLLMTTPSALGQVGQASELYGGHSNQLQSTNGPAGTVVQPGSQILYIVDTGVNLREDARVASGDSELSDASFGGTLKDVRADLYSDDDLAVGAISQTFLAITNTHPSQAVTVHFRYFNDECVDLLDFLVLLTCNDTLIFDPFNFIVPETSSNTRNRIFGPAAGILTPITASQFASGRFLIFATASGTVTTQGSGQSKADLRFPYEFEASHVDAEHHCDNLRDDTYFGAAAGIVATNLHVFNASAAAFNYLIGAQTFAQLVSETGATPISQAWGLNAWTRPAVDGYQDVYIENSNWENWPYASLGLQKLLDSTNRRTGRRHPDGDGYPLVASDDWTILDGGEVMTLSDGSTARESSYYILRAELHGGDTGRVGAPDLPLRENGVYAERQGERSDAGDGITPDYHSWWGALGTPSIFGVASEDQVINFLSIMDDYNGSGTALGTSFANDNSYNVTHAETTYVLQIYDNAENIYDIADDTTVPDPPDNISPAPPPPPDPDPPPTLKITVDCLRVWVTDVKIPANSVEDLQISELQTITTEAGGPTGWLEAVIDPQTDAAQGWIRFVRDNTQDGTWESHGIGVGDEADSASPMFGVFTTIAYQSIVQGGLGSAWWLAAVASDPWVSSTGDPTCNDLCQNGARHTITGVTPW